MRGTAARGGAAPARAGAPAPVLAGPSALGWAPDAEHAVAAWSRHGQGTGEPNKRGKRRASQSFRGSIAQYAGSQERKVKVDHALAQEHTLLTSRTNMQLRRAHTHRTAMPAGWKELRNPLPRRTRRMQRRLRACAGAASHAAAHLGRVQHERAFQLRQVRQAPAQRRLRDPPRQQAAHALAAVKRVGGLRRPRRQAQHKSKPGRLASRAPAARAARSAAPGAERGWSNIELHPWVPQQ